MSEKVTVSRVYHDTVVTKYGPKPKVAIYTKEYPDTKMSTFDKASHIKEGDVIEVTIEKKGQFTNFKLGDYKPSTRMPSPDTNLQDRIVVLEKQMSLVLDRVDITGKEDADVF